MRHTLPTLALIAAAALLGAGCASSQPRVVTPAGSTTAPAGPLKEKPGPLAGVGNAFSSLGKTITRFINNISGDTPSKYARLTTSDNPDARRIGINGLVEEDFGKKPPYTNRYLDMAREDPDPLVRAVAIRALNRSRDKQATSLFVKDLSDPNVQVRLEACKALLRVPDPDAVQPLLALLNSPTEDKDVKIAAADALRHYKRLEVVRTLVSNLSNREFGIAWQSRRSLKYLTGRDMLYDEAAWLAYLTGPEKPFG